MKLYLDDIKKIDWLAKNIENRNLGKQFLDTKNGFYFVFNYNLRSEQSGIEIVSANHLYEINDSIYRNMNGQHVGYLREPFDTSNYLFYSLLDYLVFIDGDKEKLDQMFLSFKAADVRKAKSELKLIAKANMPVTSRIDFSEAIAKIFSINQKPVNGICAVYDLIDQYTRRKLQKSIYGGYLTSFVKGIKNPNGGLIPEYAGSTMRYLIIGEKAAGHDEDLKKAKVLLRSGSSADDIYLETGWYFNRYDSKWRKRISDDSFMFDMDKLSAGSSAGSFFRKDDAMEDSIFLDYAKSILSGNMSMAQAVANGYNVRLGDFVSFEEAYKYYPKLKDIFTLFMVNMGNKSDFHYGKGVIDELVLVAGQRQAYSTIEQIQFVALHEIQHYIQNVEDFGGGGNPNIAKIIDAVGGASVKGYLLSLDAFLKRFEGVASLIPVAEFDILIDEINAIEYQ